MIDPLLTDRISSSQTWVAALPRKHADVLLGLYLVSGVEVLESEDRIWVRGPWSAQIQGVPDDDQALRLEQILRGLYGAKLYEICQLDQLVPVGKRVPTDVLPSGNWKALVDWINLELPPTCMVGKTPERSSVLSIRRVESAAGNRSSTGMSQDPSLLICSLEDWHEFATTAGQVRLDPLGFAFDSRFGVLVRGNPLPPINGQLFSLSGNVGVSLGWQWFPKFSVETVAEILELQTGEIGLLFEDQTWHRILESNFVQANRSSVRATAELQSQGKEGSNGEL